MIAPSGHFDLGLDKSRIKDPRDASRQLATTRAILDRFFGDDPARQHEIQILADEVGMGKTFVALAVAYSVLATLREGGGGDDLRGCYQKVLILTPQNPSLFAKWCREVGEFVKRCIKKSEHRSAAKKWFACSRAERVDDLCKLLRQGGATPQVVVTHMRIFAGERLLYYDLKLRFLLGALFRHWGNRFRYEQRDRLLKGAPEAWPRDPGELTAISDKEAECLCFGEDELLTALDELARREADSLETLLETCREIAEPYRRGRDDLFATVKTKLRDVYGRLLRHLLRKSLPLVIVDEAHNWKNGPLKGANGYRGFIKLIAPRARRVLLLTATPFQLRPDEMLEILKVGGRLAPCPGKQDKKERRARLESLREEVIRPALDYSARVSRQFTKAWGRLPASVTRQRLAELWESEPFRQARCELAALADARGALRADVVAQVAGKAAESLEPDARQLLREALGLYAHNRHLSGVLGTLVIRHRRPTEHRQVCVGREYGTDTGVLDRPDRHRLHAAPGLDIRGKGELPQFLLMRCVSEMKGGKGKSSLGSTLTGCYSTLLHSAEGRSIQAKLADHPVGRVYLELLQGLVDAGQDPNHPKLRVVVEAVLRAWRAGEKTLLFCFRTNTATRLRDILYQRIQKELAQRRRTCLGGEESLKALRTRLTGRDRDLIVLGLDRVLWSLFWGWSAPAPRLAPDTLVLTDADLRDVAWAAQRFGVDLTGDRVDRVFLHRAIEYAVARRLLRQAPPVGPVREAIEQMAKVTWVSHPYGIEPDAEGDDGGEEQAHFDERGVHSRYESIAEPSSSSVEELARDLEERRHRAGAQNQVSVLDTYARGPSLWLGADPLLAARQAVASMPDSAAPLRTRMHEHLWELTAGEGALDWESRRKVFQAMRRSVFRESVLVRLLPNRGERDEGRWGELLVRSFFDPLPGQRESMADRVAVLLEDLWAASGSLSERDSARFALYEATRMHDEDVALVIGPTPLATRERRFAGFNTPLPPEVLVCGVVGQEGIDLHRHCRHVVHYDLAWNPAVLEQRTGRVDRIGSKTFRERAVSAPGLEIFLEVGVPFLAGTYDERMYEEVRLRAQTFEVLTGGRLAAENAEGQDEGADVEGQGLGLRFPPLPDAMVRDLRVNLHVWSESSQEKREGM